MIPWARRVHASNMADDAGALLVRSGLISEAALDEARTRAEQLGGTIGEQLVASGAIDDDKLTDFYRSRLLVPQVNPNSLARLPIKVIASIPSDMAIELRAVPVALDHDNNLTVAMSDPSDRHAVDEIAFFTGAYVVRAVATQMQIAWCLAHYYGHLTALGHRLIQQAAEPPAERMPRTKGDTGRVEATRHRAVAPGGPIDVARPTSGQLDVPPPPPSDRAEPTPDAPANGSEDGAPQPRARSISGEIRVPVRRAPSIKPPTPEPYTENDDESGPVITMEAEEAQPVTEDPTGPLKMKPVRRRKAKTDPPELAARAGEVDAPTGPVRTVDSEPRIIIDDSLAEPVQPIASGELRVTMKSNEATAPLTTIEVDDTSVGVVIHEHPSYDSEPVLLDRRRASEQTMAQHPDDGDDVVVLEPRKKAQPTPRPHKSTQVGVGALSATTRVHRDTDLSGVPAATIEDTPTADLDATRLDTRAAPPSADDTTDEHLAAPPSPDDTGSHVAPPPLATARYPRPESAEPHSAIPRASSADDDMGPPTAVMSAVELDEAIPDRASDLGLERRIDYDAVDDGWGPPGTTIPPPLLGAIPGSDDDDGAIVRGIPISLDSQPLIVAPPSPPEPSRGSPVLPHASGTTLVRALEEATARSIALINALEKARDRNSIIQLMIDHLAESHRRAGFFAIKPNAQKINELVVFAMEPRAEIPPAALRLDRPSTLQDVVGTRLPYRGPMHDDASRTFLTNVLGACPPEILLVPVAVRERVVGVLFGEHRIVHTFDDQLALAARAAGMAFERVLKARRGAE